MSTLVFLCDDKAPSVLKRLLTAASTTLFKILLEQMYEVARVYHKVISTNMHFHTQVHAPLF